MEYLVASCHSEINELVDQYIRHCISLAYRWMGLLFEQFCSLRQIDECVACTVGAVVCSGLEQSTVTRLTHHFVQFVPLTNDSWLFNLYSCFLFKCLISVLLQLANKWPVRLLYDCKMTLITIIPKLGWVLSWLSIDDCSMCLKFKGSLEFNFCVDGHLD